MWSRAWVRRGYVLASLTVVASYPFLPAAVRPVAVLTVAAGSVPAVVVGLRRTPAGDRVPWWLLLSGMSLLVVSDVVLKIRGSGFSQEMLDAVGDTLLLAGIVILVRRRDRNDIGGLIDTTLVSLALGGLLWDLVLRQRLIEAGHGVAFRIATAITVFALAAVLGGLVRVRHGVRRSRAVWYLVVALLLALVGNVVMIRAAAAWSSAVATMMFAVAFVGVGGFGLHEAAPDFARPGPPQPDELTPARLVFLGVVLAALPMIDSVRALAGRPVEGILIAVYALAVIPLALWRIGRLAAERTRAEHALRHQATHDPLTGLVNRQEFVTQLAAELRQPYGCVLLFCDLDGFKQVNDRFGHAAGDHLLADVAQRLRSGVRRQDLVARFGGDEFTILCRDATR
ncbi:MAG: diguanylate cyclase domain-containing protein, partial [Micromonosporaceae bacterium]